MTNGATKKYFLPRFRPVGVLFGIRRYLDGEVEVASGLVRTEMAETGQTKYRVGLRKWRDFDVDFDGLARPLHDEWNLSASFGDARADGYFPIQCAGSIPKLSFVA